MPFLQGEAIRVAPFLLLFRAPGRRGRGQGFPPTVRLVPLSLGGEWDSRTHAYAWRTYACTRLRVRVNIE